LREATGINENIYKNKGSARVYLNIPYAKMKNATEYLPEQFEYPQRMEFKEMPKVFTHKSKLSK